jgi:hypothetical protein
VDVGFALQSGIVEQIATSELCQEVTFKVKGKSPERREAPDSIDQVICEPRGASKLVIQANASDVCS